MQTLSWGGERWRVRAAGRGGPGPNAWDPANVATDRSGRLHLRIARRGDLWTCAELQTERPLGAGTYLFQVETPLGRFDPGVVLGLFTYPTPDVGPDTTHEIDIEIARWGDAKNPPGNYTVWPADPALKPTSHTWQIRPASGPTLHRFVWSPKSIQYASAEGRDPAALDDPRRRMAHWSFEPPDPERRIPRAPLPLHLNLWRFQGKPPDDGKDLEVVIRSFAFTPAG